MLVGEARGEPGQRGRIGVVEQPGVERLGHQQVGLVEDAHEPLPFLGERPAVQVAPRLEHLQHPIESPSQRLGASEDLALEVVHLATDPVRPAGGPQVAIEVGTARHRIVVGVVERTVGSAVGAARGIGCRRARRPGSAPR